MTIYEQPWKLVQNKVRAEGGREIDQFRGIYPAKDTPNGAEAWIGSVTRANGVTPANPNLGCAEVWLPDGKRRYLFQVIEESPEQILEKKHMAYYGTDLGILIKLLDAKTPFLLQCHPNRHNAQKFWNSRYGKEECWYVLGVRKDMEEPPYILLGFRNGVSREDFERKYREGNIKALEAMCHKIQVHVGESYLIPGGVPHALGPGCFVAEIQEPSDLTAVPIPQEELLEFRRRANPLGVFCPEDNKLYEHRMLNSFSFKGETREKTLDLYKSKNVKLREDAGNCETEIFGTKDTDAFSCTILDVDGKFQRVDTGDIQIAIVLSGMGEICCEKSQMKIKRGDELFFPARVRNAVFSGKMSVMLCNPGMTAKYKKET